ncbi:MAG TPA: MBL fold metallo-hydrolase [Sphingobacteriaceae bacterium]
MNSVTIRVIGCGDAFGSGGRLNTCFHVSTKGFQFLIDCGATSLVGLKANGIVLQDIDLITITHFHGDHYGGLPFFLLQSAVYGRKKPLYIISPPGCKERVTQLLELLYPGTAVLQKLQVDFIEYQAYHTIETHFLTLKALPVIHTEAALPHGLRISVGNKVISYSGDTEWTEELVELSRDADLFICECNFFTSNIRGHLNYHTLRQNLSRLNFRHILLTHFDNEMLDKLNLIDLDYATDGRLIVVD